MSFQPASAAAPPGYLVDSGAVYDADAGYGWNVDLSADAANMVDRGAEYDHA